LPSGLIEFTSEGIEFSSEVIEFTSEVNEFTSEGIEFPSEPIELSSGVIELSSGAVINGSLKAPALSVVLRGSPGSRRLPEGRAPECDLSGASRRRQNPTGGGSGGASRSEWNQHLFYHHGIFKP